MYELTSSNEKNNVQNLCGKFTSFRIKIDAYPQVHAFIFFSISYFFEMKTEI